MRTLVIQARGWRVKRDARGDMAGAAVRVSGARILNRGRPQAAIYRREFLGLTRNAKTQGDAILDRSQRNALKNLWDKLPKRVRKTLQ